MSLSDERHGALSGAGGYGFDVVAFVRDCMKKLPPPYFSPAVTLDRSGIAGYGLIARRGIEPGEVLVIERGPRVDGRLVQMIEVLTGYETNCCIGWNEYTLHAPLHEDGAGGYINHSCDPNAGMLLDATWVAMRGIAPGEEVTCDYGTFETARDWEMPCGCGAAACRRVITGRDFLLPDLRARLGQWFAPYLRRDEVFGGHDAR